MVEVRGNAGMAVQVTIFFCRGCGRYLQPPRHWVKAELESRELLTFCVKRIRGLSKVPKPISCIRYGTCLQTHVCRDTSVANGWFRLPKRGNVDHRCLGPAKLSPDAAARFYCHCWDLLPVESLTELSCRCSSLPFEPRHNQEKLPLGVAASVIG